MKFKKPFLIAEISANHGGKIGNAKKLILLAKKGGANAVKLQTYDANMMTLNLSDKRFIIQSGIWKNYKLWDLYNKAHTPLNWHKELFTFARKNKIEIFSSPFSEEAVDLLEKLKCKFYKIASFEMNDLNLIKKVAKTNKPMIISTGLANLSEISRSVKVAKKFGCKDLTLLYCVSNYPSENNDFNLNNLEILKKKFKCRVGLSDHSVGSSISCMSIVKGAEVIEKHICLNNVKTVDSKFSLDANNISKFKKDLNDAYDLVNNKKFSRTKSELGNKIFRRSIYATSDIKKNQKFSKKNIKTFRPELGLSATYYLKILGLRAPFNIKKNSPLSKKLNKLI
tara:strand:- start:20833 stop:21849 length:1017 start_codon:yes stop_codon:yes gene_type:complete